METSTLTKYAAIGVFIVAVSVLFWGFAPRDGNTISFEIDTSQIQGFNVLNSDGAEINGFAQCFFKVRNELTNSDGEVIQERNSQFYISSPGLLSLQDARDDRSDKSGFNVKPRIRCEGEIGTNQSEPANTKLVIESYKLKIDVYSQNSKQELVHTYTKEIDSFVDATMAYGQEYELTSHRVSPTNIFTNLDAGRYDSWQEFRVSGEIKFYFEELKAFPLTITIPDSNPNDDCECSPRTYFLVLRDTVDPNSGQPSPGEGGGVIIVVPDPEPETPDNDGSDGVIQGDETCDPPEFPDFSFECVTQENAIWLGLGLVVIVALVKGGHHAHKRYIGIEEWTFFF